MTIPGGTSYDLGTITSISDSFGKSCAVTPLASLPADAAFTLESKTNCTYSISFSRVQPSTIQDTTTAPSTSWSNGFWWQQVMAAVNRWQCRTNGFELTYIPAADNPYISEIDEEGYVKNLSINYSYESNTTLTGSFEFHVGTMYVSTQASTAVTMQDEFTMTINDSTNTNEYLLMGSYTDDSGEQVTVNCVKSYTLCGGLESPFEYIQVKIPKKRLSSVVPELIDVETGECDIVAGKNRLTVNAVGESTMVVTKCKLSGDTYTITAYCTAEALKGYTLNNEGYLSPYQWIIQILTTGIYGVSYTPGSTLLMHYNEENNQIGDLHFAAGTNVWYVLQVAAMCLGCRVFFAHNRAYVIDYRMSGQDDAVRDYGNIDLYPTESGATYASAVVGDVSLGDEGTDTLVNVQSIRFSQVTSMDPGAEVTVTEDQYRDQESVNEFGEQEGNRLYITELRRMPEVTDPDTGEVTTQAVDQPAAFGNNYISYRSEPQQSIEFTLKEMRDNGGPAWASTFNLGARATRITDDVNENYITNDSDIAGRPAVLQKLCLSTFERNYPEGTTTYTWGVMSSIDLSTSTSQIVSNLSNV